MGAMELGARRERRWGTFQKAMLIATLAGVMVATGAAPSPTLFRKYFRRYKKGARFNYQAKTALGRLAAKSMVTFEEHTDGERYARITEKGKRVLLMETKRVFMKKKKKWDRRWRVVIFDISERRKRIRDRLRQFMSSYGFVRLQDSVWIYPHDCEDLIALAKADFRIGADVLYMTVERLERDKYLREHFNLSPE